MGVDKATIVVDGVRMIDRVVGAVRGAAIDEIVIAGRAGTRDDAVDVVADVTEGFEGPMAGIVSAWRHLRPARPDPVVVVSCDLPRLDPTVVGRLLEAGVQHPHGAVAHDGQRLQPLVACYRAQAMELLDTAFERGERSLRRLFGDWDLGVVPVDPLVVADADERADLASFDVEWPDEPGAAVAE